MSEKHSEHVWWSKVLARWKMIVGIVASVITASIATYNFVRPGLVFASDLEAEINPIKAVIAQQQKSISNIERILTLNEIRTVSKEIADLEYRRDHDPDNWTRRDAQDLSEAKTTLDELRDDLKRLRSQDS